MAISTDGGPPRKITDMFISEGSFSPDGKRIVYDSFVKERQGDLFRRQMVVVDAETGKPVLPMIPWQDGFALRWAPTGDALVYVKELEGVGNLWRQPLDGSAPRRITDFPAQLIFFYDWSPDGKQIYFARGQFTSDMVLISDFH